MLAKGGVDWPWLGLLTALSIGACSGERSDAQRLLERIEAVDVRLELPARVGRVEALERLRLDEPGLVQMRDACVSAHRALLEAEEFQQQAQRKLTDMESASAVGTQSTPGRIPSMQDVEQAIVRSQHATARAQSLFPACERHKRALKLRLVGRAGS